jgi:autotransporter-associated beta strand protein
MRLHTIVSLAAAAVLAVSAARADAAVLRVTSPRDTGDGTLRASFAEAQSGDRIVLALPDKGAATIKLANPLPPLASGLAIELRTDSPDVTITGGGLALESHGSLAFEVAPGRTLVLDSRVTGVEGDRGVALAGGGTLVLAQPCDYRGGTIVTEATLKLADAGALPTKGGLTLMSGRFELGPQDAEVGALAGEDGTVALGARTLSIDEDSDSDFQGVIAGAGQLVKAGAGRLKLRADIGWSGGTTITGGVLELAGTGPGAKIRGPVMVKGGALIAPGLRMGAGGAAAPP